MKYMLLMSGTKDMFEWYSKWPQEDLARNIAFMRNFSKELKESGVLVETAGLGFPDQAKLVKAGKNGEPITDGVFPESKEYLAGYWIIDVKSKAEAVGWARRCPAPMGETKDGVIEIRQVFDASDFPPDVLTPETAAREQALRSAGR